MLKMIRWEEARQAQQIRGSETNVIPMIRTVSAPTNKMPADLTRLFFSETIEETEYQTLELAIEPELTDAPLLDKVITNQKD